MLMDIFQYEDYTIYESAQVLGLSKVQQFLMITLPNMRKTLISVIFATFTLIFTDYGVPLVVGGKVMTLPVYMYRKWWDFWISQRGGNRCVPADTGGDCFPYGFEK